MVNVVRCVEQLRIGQHQAIGWISDGSASKVVFGTLKECSVCNGGLRLIIIDETTGKQRSVRWRMSEHDAYCCIDMFYQPKTVAMIPLALVERVASLMPCCETILAMSTGQYGTEFNSAACYSYHRPMSRIVFI